MKFCMIGSRGHWSYVFQSLPELDGWTLAGGSEDGVGRLAEAARAAGCAPAEFADYREMLDRVAPDLVCIDGPFDRHAEMCLEAIRRGIHIFCEKPIALTPDELDAIRRALADRPVQIMSMIGLRYEPSFYFARRLVAENAIGRPKLIQAQKSYKLGVRPEFYRRRASYGGTIPWVGSHAIDWVMAFGGVDFHSVWAAQSRTDNAGHGDLEISAQCLFTMQSGLLASVSIDYLRPAAAPTHGDDRLRVAGTAGVLEVGGGKVTLTDRAGFRELPVPPPDRKVFSDLAIELAGGRPRLADNAQTLLLTEACLRARESADTGRVIYF